MSRTTLTSVIRDFSRPRFRLYRLRSAIIKILNAGVAASMLTSMSGVALASAASDADTNVEIPLPAPYKSIEALVEPNIVQSTFDSDDEGWTIVGDGDGPTYNATGGNPGGYISSTDQASSEYWYWQAPAKFLDDQSAAYGRTLSFDLVQSVTDDQDDQDDVVLVGDGITLVFDTSYNPGDTWTHYVVTLHESAGWLNSSTGLAPSSIEFTQVLTNLESLLIRGEYRVGDDTGGLDNAAFSVLCPETGNLIVPIGTSCWLEAGEYTFDSITVEAGGLIYLEGDPVTGEGVILNSTTIVVESGGEMTATALGYPIGQGPGAGSGTDKTGGGGHGGYGGNGTEYNAIGGVGYGSLFEPITLGSGAGDRPEGGTGGGAIHLIVNGTLQLDGTVLADGGAGTQYERGGGAGGSIWIEAASLAGSGLIRTNGGNAGYMGGGGAGGRIAIDASSNSFTGSVNAHGGTGNQAGGAGTIYWTVDDHLVVDNGGNSGKQTPLEEDDYDFESITLNGNAILQVEGANSSITLDNTTIQGDGTGRLTPFGTAYVPVDLIINDYTLNLEGQMPGVQTVTVESGGGLMFRPGSQFYSGSYAFQSIEVRDGGKLYAYPYIAGGGVYSNDYGLTLEVGNLTVDAGGEVTATGLGYPIGQGPGVGSGSDDTGGGGHGGLGGNGIEANATGGGAYGSLFEPITLGSGAGNVGQGGSGGGAIHLLVSGTLQLDGTISVDGGSSTQYERGGGAGGSIWVEAASFTGTGLIRANGGNGGTQGGGGGGGRIAIDASSNSFTGSVNASGGTGNERGGFGTIYWTVDDHLVIDNGGVNARPSVIVEGDYDLNLITLSGNAILRVEGASSSITLDNTTVQGDGTGRLIPFGTVLTPAAFTVDNFALDLEGKFDGVTNLTVGSNGELILRTYTALYSGIHTFSSVDVVSAGRLIFVPYNNGDSDYTNDSPFELHVDTLNIDAAGIITAEGSGYPRNQGPGTPTSSGGGGGGHGGAGGNGLHGSGGTSYGSLYQPVLFGSGGADDANGAASGGGAIILVVENAITVNGILSVDGASNSAVSSSGSGGGGSGGSIWVTADTLNGSGVVSADGGNSTNGGGGAGGRIAVYAETVDPNLSLSVMGGAGGDPGDLGTTYLGNLDPTLSSITIDPDTVPTLVSSYGEIRVTLRNEFGLPIPGKPVSVALISGDEAYINDQLVGLNDFIDIGLTDIDGNATGTIRAETLGLRTVRARSEQELILAEATVEFIPGPFDPGTSTIDATPQQVPADGSTPANLIVTTRDAFGNPVPGAEVTLTTPSGTLTQPATPTDANGQTSGTLTHDAIEAITVSALVDSVMFDDEATVDFHGSDLEADITAPDEAIADGTVTYSITVKNMDLLTANGVTATLELPAEVTYLYDSAPTDPTQNGNELTWELDALPHNNAVSFSVTTDVNPTVPAGSTLTGVINVSTTSPEANTSNNVSSDSTTIVDAFDFTVALIPTSATLNMGGAAQYTIRIRNVGFVGDSYAISVDGLDANWIELGDNEIGISPGASRDVTLTISPDGCQAEEILPFSVSVQSNGGTIKTAQGEVSLVQVPNITLDKPKDNSTSGSRSVLFSWRTNPTTTGTLTVYPQGQPAEAQTFNSSQGATHNIQVEDLERYVTYEWYVQADSTCGTQTSATRTFTVGSGIVFVSRNPSFELARDYDQRFSITVRNDDSEAHTLLATVQNPYEDLILNFVGSGSVDETITLSAGQSRTLELVVHAQDATNHEYDLLAEITADDGTSIPLTDNTSIHLTVLFEFDVSVVEDSVDPITGVKTYTVTNNGLPITDLEISAADPTSGEPARVMFLPSISHGKLDTGDSVTFDMIPLFDERDVAGMSALPSGGNLASYLPNSEPGIISANLIVGGAGQEQVQSSNMSCPSGSVHSAPLEDVCLELQNSNWYCTNKPNISMPFYLPFIVEQDLIESVNLQMDFHPRSNVQDHTTSISLNGELQGTLDNMIPNGTFSTRVPPDTLHTSEYGSTVQELELNSVHNNPGHYVSVADFSLGIGLQSTTAYVCAESPEDASENAMDAFHLKPSEIASACASVGIPVESVLSSGDDCCAAYGATQVNVGGEINTRTGGMDYSFVDISIPTSAGTLSFKRWYSTLTLEDYADTLGYGWTHSLDTRLIFPDDPLGREGVVLMKLHASNRYQFTIEDDGTFTPFPGFTGELTASGDPLTFTYATPGQYDYHFDADGKLISRSDPRGNALQYTYNAEDRLIRVEDDNGQRYLELDYDALGRVNSVQDHTDRGVTFNYNAAGDLSSSVDLLGGTWTYFYDPTLPHYLSEVRDPSGTTLERTVFDEQGRAVEQYNGEGELAVRLEYEGFGSTKVYEATGNQSMHVYDSNDAIERQEDPLGGLNRREYDDNFRPTMITDEDGDTTHLTWSEDGTNLTQVIDAEGNPVNLSYDENNNLTSIVDPLDTETSYAYDGLLLTSSTDDEGNTTSYTYTPEGYLQSITDAAGNTTSYTYDSYGQQVSMTDASGNTWLYRYDDLGRLIENEDPNGVIARREYDAAGRMIRSTRNYDPARPQNDENLYNIVTEYVYDAVGNQIEVIDTFGRSTQYVYDDANRLIRMFDSAGNETTNTFNNAGQLVATTDVLDRITTFVYDELGRMVEMHDALGNITTTVYNPDGTVASTSDALGNSTSYTYDDLKRVAATTDALDGTTTTTYDELGNVIATTDALGNTTTYEYNSLGQLTHQTDPEGGNIQYVYDELGNRIETIDPRGNSTFYVYDDQGRLETVTDALGGTTTYTYDALGRRLAITDAEDNTTSYSYDELGRQVSVTDPLGNTTSTEFDALGNVLSRTDANEETTTYVYDVLGRLESQTDPLGGITTYTYDAASNQLTVTDAEGHTTTTVYDELNRPVSVTDPLGNTTTTAHDATGNVLATTDGSGQTITFTYDELGRQETVTDPLGNTTSYAYDAVGNRISLTDTNGVVTRYEYDGLNRLTAVVENYLYGAPADHETNVRTEYSYDANGNRLTILDGRSHSTTFSYDELNRLESEADPLGNTTSYAYDAVGNRVSLTDAEGFTTNYVYDDTGRLTTIDYPAPDDDVSFNYDNNGNRLSMSDGAGTTSWVYDELGRVTSVTDPFGETVSYAYDGVGNRVTLTYPDGETVSYAYDSSDRLTQVADWDSGVTDYSYDSASRLSTATLPNGVVTTYSYDNAGQLLELTHEADDTTLSSFNYTYDSVGNRTQVAEYYLTPGGGTGGPTVSVQIVDERGDPLANLPVYAFDDSTYTGYHETTDENGEAAITLPEGNYRFRVDVDSAQFWSGETNHCAIAGCTEVLFTIPDPVLVSVQDTSGTPIEGLPVYVFDETTYTGKHSTTDENGEAILRLVEGSYRFRADPNGTQFWSAENNHCDVPGCTLANVSVTIPVTVTVMDSLGMPAEGIPVYAFSGGSYSGYHGTSDANGQVSLTLPQGDYRFRADSGGTQFWSGETDHCSVPGCLDAAVEITLPVTVTVEDSDGTPLADLPVYAFDESTYTGFHAATDANGEVSLTLPAGEYRFRADSDGTQFWSGESNHCAVPGCSAASVTVTLPVTVTVLDTDGQPAEGLPVYAFDETTYTGYQATTDASGQVSLTLPLGDYRFRADKNGTQFWSGESNHCTVPGCSAANVTVTLPIVVTVLDTDEQPAEGLPVYAFNETTYTGYHATTDSAGQVSLTLPQGEYRFRADKNGTQFWSGESNHCTVPDCTETSVTVTLPVTVSVLDINEQPLEGVPVYAFDESTYTGYHATTDASGQVSLTLPPGDYRFRADYDGTQYWSGDNNHCSVPGCTAVTLVADETPPVANYYGAKRSLAMILPVRLAQGTLIVVTVLDTDGQPAEGLPVYAFDESIYTGVHGTTDAAGQVSLDLPDGAYRFRADFNPLSGAGGTQFWSGETNHCTVPDCTAVGITVTIPLTVTVLDTDGQPAEGLPVYAFNESAYTGYHATTDVNGQVSLTLPQGAYRFRADKDGTQFWSGESNHCTLPGCSEASITVTLPITITVLDTDEQPVEGLPVYAFDETTYTGYHATTDASGQVSLTLPPGDYRFRTDKDGTHFWSGASNHCTLPGCTEAGITVTLPITVTVLDTNGQPAEGLPVYAFNETTYTGYHATTDAAGQVSLTLPEGDYRFRADKNGTQFWSGESNHCSLPDCTEAGITVTIPVTVNVQSQTGDPYPDLPVYAFSADSYTGFHGTTDENGQVSLTLPQGDYRFRADYTLSGTGDGVHFWSGESDHCTVPGCLEVTVELPGGGGSAPQSVTIDYTYDPLYRLTAADYDSGEYFHYSYDAVGNRLTQETQAGTNSYTYDNANRLIEVDGVSYTWTANGNLLTDGESTYTYNHANRLTGVTQGEDSYSYVYNGLGDRLTQTVNGEAMNYTLDLVTGLTQVLDDGTNAYLYGLDRVGEQQPAGWAYHLPDALGSVRQLTDADPEVTLARAYEPFGSVMASSGSGETNYSFTGEWADGTGLIHLRARYYIPWQSRFMSKDTWQGESSQPISFHRWMYANDAPITSFDPTGHYTLPSNLKRNPCGFPFDWHECILYKFYKTRASVTEEPPLIWNPSVTVYKSPSIGHIQFKILSPLIPTLYSGENIELPGEPLGFNLCGQISLEMIFESTIGKRSGFGIYYMYELFNETLNATFPYQIATAAVHAFGDNFSVSTHVYDRNRLWTLPDDPIEGKFTADSIEKPSGWASLGEYGLFSHLRAKLSDGRYLIPLVSIKASSYYGDTGELLPKTGMGNTSGHWVVLSGMSENNNWRGKNPSDSYINWVRIMNPFHNQAEYYLWRDFEKSWSSSRSLVEISPHTTANMWGY